MGAHTRAERCECHILLFPLVGWEEPVSYKMEQKKTYPSGCVSVVVLRVTYVKNIPDMRIPCTYFTWYDG